VLGGLPIPLDPNVLVGFATSDDAAVYKLTDELAIALTVDIFTPVVDDPYWFGAIAAANALSDIYAMGAKPMAMLSFAGFPRGKLEWDVLTQILRGGAEKAREAGVDVVGGHTVDDPEPKAGYAVFGTVNPSKIVTNAGGQDGDILVLTKPLGIGVLSTALKQGRLSESQIEHVTQVMAKLNRAAAEAMIEVGVHACTDITRLRFPRPFEGNDPRQRAGSRGPSRVGPCAPRRSGARGRRRRTRGNLDQRRVHRALRQLVRRCRRGDEGHLG